MRFYIALFAGISLAVGQNPQAPAQQEDVVIFRSGTNLATVRFNVVKKNRFLEELGKDDIVLLEDGKPQTISFFEGGRKARRTSPIDVALVFDISGSVLNDGMLDMAIYKAGLLDGFENVRLSVYGFNSRLFRYSPLTRDTEHLAAAMQRVRDFKSGALPKPTVLPLTLAPKRKSPQGGSWIFPAVAATARDLATIGEANSTKFILVFSDGFETTDAKPEDAANVAKELGVVVYPVALGHNKLTERAKQILANGEPKPGSGAANRLENIRAKEMEILELKKTLASSISQSIGILMSNDCARS